MENFHHFNLLIVYYLDIKLKIAGVFLKILFIHFYMNFYEKDKNDQKCIFYFIK